jgi:RNA polymerase sigma-70 factor (ECF subfamily)
VQQLTDEELYGLARSGDPAAFAELYERHEPALFRYALHLTGRRETAEELTQEIFVRLLEAPAGRFDPARGRLVAYLYGVARNLVRESKRRVSVGEPEEQAVECDLAGGLIEHERAQALYAALERLGEGYREAVVLCDLEELSYENAAERMGCAIGTVRSRVHRGRRLLARELRLSEHGKLAAGEVERG